MRVRNPMKDPVAAMRLGMSSLILASLSHWFLQRDGRLESGLVDGGCGFLYGVAIACLLQSLRLNRRGRSAGDAG